jgi:hypothetical protein
MATKSSTLHCLTKTSKSLSVRIAEAEFNQHQPDVIVGSSRGGAVAVNMQSGDTPLVLLCPAWKNWGTGTTVNQNTIILHSRANDLRFKLKSWHNGFCLKSQKKIHR